jgi:CpeT/CpcT family (DUF1001)
MTHSAALVQLAAGLAGEFDNREQAIADPVWFVHLRLWHRPVNLFAEDSLTLFAEQANILQLDRPYRQRLLRLQPTADPQCLQVQYYAFKTPSAVKGAGQNPALLQNLTLDDIEYLPGCILTVPPAGGDRYLADPPPGAQCYFTYQEEIRQVCLGFATSSTEFLSFDKGVDPKTGQALWGALMGPYRFTKRLAYPLPGTRSVTP